MILALAHLAPGRLDTCHAITTTTLLMNWRSLSHITTHTPPHDTHYQVSSRNLAVYTSSPGGDGDDDYGKHLWSKWYRRPTGMMWMLLANRLDTPARAWLLLSAVACVCSHVDRRWCTDGFLLRIHLAARREAPIWRRAKSSAIQTVRVCPPFDPG